MPTTIFVTTGSFTPPLGAFAVARGTASVRRTSFGWSVALPLTSSLATSATPCLLRNGVYVLRFQTVGVPSGSAAVALALPRGVFPGTRTIRLTLTSGGSVRTLFYPDFLG